MEFHGRLEGAGGWLFCGWSRSAWAESTDGVVHAAFASGGLTGTAISCFFRRPDLPGHAVGFAVLLYPVSAEPGPLAGLEIRQPRRGLRLAAGPAAPKLPEPELTARCQAAIALGPPTPGRAALLSVLSRSGAGSETLPARLRQPVQIEVGDCIPVPPRGLALIGWMIDPLDCVRRLRVRSGTRMAYLDDTNRIRVPRRDISDAIGGVFGVSDRDCGFIAFLPDIHAPGEEILVEAETSRGEMTHRPPPARPRAPLAAMRRILESFSLRDAALAEGFDRVIGPALEALNAARLRQRPEVTQRGFGSQPRRPAASIIVPLYGRMDFIEHQMAQFSADAALDAEIIYVLDDPARRAEAEEIAHSSHARFGVPFRLLLLDRNAGFAVACNIGAAHASGDVLCFLNSDVFPDRPGWLAALAGTLAKDRRAGIVGARLLYEDGSLQHDGCTYQALPDMAGWRFPMHPGKGRVPPAPVGARSVDAVTGACLLIRRDLFRQVGGFDERYAIGDFEDSDLCQKVRERGLTCVLRDDVALYHLERQSQAAPEEAWRANLTLFNAWQHERRWAKIRGAFRAA